MTKKVTILIGISGSGKSSYIRENLPGAAVVSADFYFMRDGEYVFDPSQLGEAHKACMRAFIEYCKNPLPGDNNNIVVDNTNTTMMELAPYAAVAGCYDCEVELVVLHCSPLVAGTRNSHGTPMAAVEGQYTRLQKLLERDEHGRLIQIPPWWPIKEIQNG